MIDPTHDCHVVTRWRVAGTCGEVADVLGDPLDLVRWWPSVHRSAEEVAPAGADGTGRRLRLRTRGWLPYTLTCEFALVEQYYPNRIVFDVAGDIVGRGTWTFVQDGPTVTAVFDWRIRAATPRQRRLWFLLAPLLAANHRWAMAQGEESLALELQRRRTLTSEQRAAIPSPPGPVTYTAVAVIGGAAIATMAALFLAARARRSRRRRAIRR